MVKKQNKKGFLMKHCPAGDFFKFSISQPVEFAIWWPLMKQLNDLFIKGGTYSCCEHITGVFNIYSCICVGLMVFVCCMFDIKSCCMNYIAR